MRRILVTGANKGIGLAIVQAILKNHDDTFVFLGSRDAERGKKACETIGSDRVQVVALDVASDDSVAAAAEQVKAAVNGESLYGIVNNAGIGLGSDALETVLNVNVRGIKRVSDSFLSLLDKPDTRSWTLLPGRVAIARTSVPPGEHKLDVQIPGVSESRSMIVDVPAGGFAVVVVTVPR